MATKSQKTKVRAVPDFSKLHNKWQQKLQVGKACAKKPCTVVHEFEMTKGGEKIVQRLRTKSIAGKNFPDKEEFSTDKRALRSIMNHEGISDRNTTGRATVAGNGLKANLKAALRPSEYFTRAKSTRSKDNGASKATRSHGKSTKRKATSPLSDSNITSKVKQEMGFEMDQEALQSILNNKGVHLDDVKKVDKTPIKSTIKHQGHSDMRASTYSRVPVDRGSMFTDYKSRMFSRLTLGGNVSPAALPRDQLKNDPHQAFIQIRNSIYVRPSQPPVLNLAAPVAPSSTRKVIQKAGRVLITPAPGSPRLRQSRHSSQRVKKWKDVLEGRANQDPVKKTLFTDDAENMDENTLHLQQLAEKELEVQQQIVNLEKNKLERKRQRTESQPDSHTAPAITQPPHTNTGLPTVEESQRHMKIIEQEERLLLAEIAAMEKKKHQKSAAPISQPTLPQEDENPLAAQDKPQEAPRNPFQALSKSQIAYRSSNLPVDSDSECEDPCGSSSGSDTCPRFPQSPLAKSSSCQFISPNTVAHGAASKVRQTTSSATKSRAKSDKRNNIITPRSPRCRDLWSPSRGRVEKSPRRTPRSPKPTWSIQGPGSPLYSHIMSKVSENIMKAPLSSITTYMETDIGCHDKENMMPAHTRIDPSPKITRYVEDGDPMMNDVFDTSVDKLNQSIAEVTYQFDELVSEAARLNESSFHEANDVVDNSDILSQLEMIKQKQDELLKMERKLQKQLFRQKYGSPKTNNSGIQPKSAKKKLVMGSDDMETDNGKTTVPPVTEITEKTLAEITTETSIPEITEKASKLDISSELPTEVTVEDVLSPVTTMEPAKTEIEHQSNMTYENILPTPPIPPRNKIQRVVSPEALRPKPPTPKIITHTFSPQPIMAGTAMLFRCISPAIAAPIQTPLALRNAALIAKNSPIDLTVKSDSSSANSTFSPDITFSYLNDIDENSAPEELSSVAPSAPVLSSLPHTVASIDPVLSSFSTFQSAQTTPAKSSTKLTTTLTTAMCHNDVMLSCHSDLLGSVIASPSIQSRCAVASPRIVTCGSLSLAANLTPRAPQTSRFIPLMSGIHAQRYYDAVLDDEVALFMDRLFPIQKDTISGGDHGCNNPLASLLQYGDDMHFVPIREETDSSFCPVNGSAFMSYVHA